VRWGDVAQHDPVQRQAHLIGQRLVDADDPPLDRSVVAPAQHRRGDLMAAQPRDDGAGQNQHQRAGKGAGQRRPAQPAGGRKRHQRGAGGPVQRRRLGGQQEVAADAEREEYRNEGEKPPCAIASAVSGP
jgi:hypothetical protein